MATNERLTIEMHDPERVIMQEIADKQITQTSLAITYAFLFAQVEGDTADWPKINQAIIERWSRSGLQRVKTMAHKICMEWKMRGEVVASPTDESTSPQCTSNKGI